MHKKIKLFVSMLAVAAMLVLLPDSNALTVNAAGNTFSLKYFGGDINDWRFVSGNTFEDGIIYHREMYALKTLELKDGDTIVVYSGDTVPGKPLDLSEFQLSNVTVHQNASAIIMAKEIKDCYVLAGAYTSINANVTNAYLYDNTTCNFNGNVLDMVLNIADKPYSNISCSGTVGHFRILSNTDTVRGEFFDIPENTMRFENGTVQYATWAPEPSAAYLQARAEADGTAAPADTTAGTPAEAPAGSSAPAAGSTSSEYDKVPKTGDSNLTVWLLTGIAAGLFAGSRVLCRKTK